MSTVLERAEYARHRKDVLECVADAVRLAIERSFVPTSSTSALTGISFARFAARVRIADQKSVPWAVLTMSFPAITAFGQ
jgi:hypothetical protein